MSVRQIIKGQILSALTDAKFPINTPELLLNAFPQGANTTCKAGDLEVTAGQAGNLLNANDFPFKSAEDVAETIVSRAGLSDE
ncbi:MTH865 family protein [Sporomusa sp.]|uniref:MTH865 family protein n=1 Tax=Sporomusa sp. TaxID=2078658 RepID=UPI002CF097B2|nr:MTH865 family protein [Sporomusa sp.]HWR44835.1 MTH865 family protein [Sporomusa sp.]